MKNRLTDLNDHLFAQMERLGAEGLSAQELEAEVQRSAALVQVADRIVANARVQLAAVQLLATHGDEVAKHLPMLPPGPVAERRNGA